MGQAEKCFIYVAQAIDTEMVTGNSASQVVNDTRVMLKTVGATEASLTQVLQQNFSPEAQQKLASIFLS